MNVYRQKSISLLNNILFAVLVVFVIGSVISYLNLRHPIISLVSISNIIICVSCIILNKFYKTEVSKFLISVFIPVSLVFGGAYAKSIGVTDNVILFMAPQLVVAITILIPVLLFGYRELRKTIIAAAPGIILFISYNKIHNLFGIKLKELTFEPEYYFMYIVMIVIFLLFVLISILLLQKSNFQHESELQSYYRGLIATEEELRENNDELLALNENLKNKNKIIEEAEKKYSVVFENTNDAVLVIKDGKFVDCNKATLKMLKYNKKEDLLNTHPSELSPEIQPDGRLSYEKANEMIKIALAEGAHKFEWIHRKATGNDFPVNVWLTAIKIRKRIIIHTVWRDLTEQKKTETRILKQFGILKKSELKLKKRNEELKVLNEGINEQYKILQEKENLISAITTKANDAIVIVDGNNVIEFWNSTAEKIFKYRADEIIGKKLHETIVPERYAEKQIKSFTKYQETGKSNIIGKQIELEALTKDKETIMIELSLSSVMINNKRHAIGIARNITERNNHLKKLSEQKEIIEQSHKDITDSLIYAKSIQDSLLTPIKLINTILNDYFILFKPKMKVSGDFYYVNKIDNILTFSVADCTGHGIPGGFLTMLGITYLHEIIRGNETKKPSDSLKILRNRIKASFGATNENKNGLDIALCFIDINKNILQYAGAYNPIYIIRDNELTEFKATNNPIGHHPVEKEFENNEFQLKNEDMIYLSSDGYQDQFGGERHKKFNKRRFKEMLLKIHKLPLNIQEKKLHEIFLNWKKDVEQVDDVTIMAIKWKI